MKIIYLLLIHIELVVFVIVFKSFIDYICSDDLFKTIERKRKRVIKCQKKKKVKE